MAIDAKYGKLDIPGLEDDEPIFILRGRDSLAIGVLDEYIFFCDENTLVPESVAVGVGAVRDSFIAWQKENSERLPG